MIVRHAGMRASNERALVASLDGLDEAAQHECFFCVMFMFMFCVVVVHPPTGCRYLWANHSAVCAVS